jgi:transcriptional regulator with XRE-family HTH domain
MEALMDRIRELRNIKGVSQARLAVTAGMDPATLNRIEQGKGNPNLKTLEKLADALGVGVIDLLEEAPKALAR